MQKTMLRRRPGRDDAGSEGFTLIELLIVLLVLGVLAATVVYAVQGVTGDSVEAACGYDYKDVESAVEAYKAELGSYPDAGVTDTQGANANAAGTMTSSLMEPSPSSVNPTPNPINPAGPWLKDVPQNGTHYYIWVANNGTGKITVGTGSPSETAPNYANCAAAPLS
jgi:prepilin-type N-terminal cleavage/methylation domain-containing protein